MVRFVLLLLLLVLSGCEKDRPFFHDEQDNYLGNAYNITLSHGVDSIHISDLVLYIKSEDGSVFSRRCNFNKNRNEYKIELFTGLKSGKYELLYFQDQESKKKFGLGPDIEVSDEKVEIKSKYNHTIGMYGEGSESAPYKITSEDHLVLLAKLVNSSETNKLITSSTHFKQSINLDLGEYCFNVPYGKGWEPIGFNNNLPFRGVYDGDNCKISNLSINRVENFFVGLFGTLHKAQLRNIHIDNATVYGQLASGILAGSVITAGGANDASIIEGCKILRSRISDSKTATGGTTSVSIGGILGLVDLGARLHINKCQTDEQTEITSAYGAGGIVGSGAIYSKVAITECINNAKVSSAYSCAGGIVGTADSILISSCKNYGAIAGALMYTAGSTDNSGRGIGGIIGGSGPGVILSSYNFGDVSGFEGVGGIIGSTRIGNDENGSIIYNNIIVKYSSNSGNISGKANGIGGICGEGQFGGFALVNTGNVSGVDDIGGIAGLSPVSGIHNSVNTGKISGRDRIGGILGSSLATSLAINTNFGNVDATGTAIGGIVGSGGKNTVVHYCSNCGNIASQYLDSVLGGICGEAGTTAERTPYNIACIAVGSIEMIVMPFVNLAFAGITHGMLQTSKKYLGIKLLELGLNGAFGCFDAYGFGIGISDYYLDSELEDLEENLKGVGRTDANNINNQLNSIRTEKLALWGTAGYTDDFVKFYTASDSNEDLINNNINTTIEDIAQEIQNTMDKITLAHNAIAGIALFTSSACLLAGTVVGGVGTAIVFALSTAASVVGGANTVVQNAVNFEENVMYITQSFNSGRTSTGGSYKSVGGIVGQLNDFASVSDCINVGTSGAKGQGGQIAGEVRKENSIMNCILAADPENWGGMYSSESSDSKKFTIANVYYLNDKKLELENYESCKSLTAKEMSDSSQFASLSMTGDLPLWKMGKNYPLPYRSEMQKPLQ